MTIPLYTFIMQVRATTTRIVSSGTRLKYHLLVGSSAVGNFGTFITRGMKKNEKKDNLTFIVLVIFDKDSNED